MGDAAGVVEVMDRYELRATLGPLALGSRDRAVRFEGPTVAWRATRTPDGPGTARYHHRAADRVVEVEAWGPGADHLIAHAPDVLGVHDDLAGFADLVAADAVVARLHRQRPGIRIGRTGNVFEALVPTICAQKVTGLEARRAWQGIVGRWGEPAPGPAGQASLRLRVPPAPATIAAAGYHEFHRMGLERRRADVIRAVAAAADRLQPIVAMAPADAEARLRSVAGIGIWSAAEVRRLAMGDADAVSYGDYHLPHAVSFTLLGRRRGSDELMHELLAPFAPHRGRVVRLIELAGSMAPRRGPRLAPNGMVTR